MIYNLRKHSIGTRRDCSYLVEVLIGIALWFFQVAYGSRSEPHNDHFQCERFLSSETILINSAATKLLEIHIRDNVQVSNHALVT